MAGVKGRSGGPRPNSGGARPGAGRKPNPPAELVPVDESDPLAFLLLVMQGKVQADALQVRAAVAAAQYVHIKKGDGGKKEEAAEAAEKASTGRFAGKAPPRLVANG